MPYVCDCAAYRNSNSKRKLKQRSENNNKKKIGLKIQKLRKIIF